MGNKLRRQNSDVSQKDCNVSDTDTRDYSGDYGGDYKGDYELSVLIIFCNWPLGPYMLKRKTAVARFMAISQNKIFRLTN